jgi:hypothetical protein
MPFDSSGNFSRNRSWVTEAGAGTKIRSDNHDSHDGDVANGLSMCITKNGSTTITADIPWSGKKITNLADPINPQDAVTKKFVENFRTFSTSIHLTGSAANGQVYFDAATGANGLSWTKIGADGVSFAARNAEASKTSARWVFNNKSVADTNPTGDVLVIDESGHINNNGVLTNNLSTTDKVTWRTILPGFGAMLAYGSGGDFRLSSNDIASITNPYMPVTLREFFTARNDIGNAIITLNKSGPLSSVQKSAYIQSQRLGLPRWLIYMGDSAVESGTRVGSNFSVYGYDNNGANPVRAFSIDRLNCRVTFDDQVNVDSIIQSTDATMILASAANGNIYLRPNGAASNIEETVITSNGDMLVGMDLYAGYKGATGFGVYAGAGVRNKTGNTGSYGSYWMNSHWNGTAVVFYANASIVGTLTACDYRIKKDIAPLASTWEAVKRLNPISYTQRAYEVWINDETPRWGFLAHELQERFTASAATGVKDGPDVQTPDLMAVIAGLTRALQEAMARIEALEAAA